MASIEFLKKEIKKMERNTHHNRHSENLVLLSKKIKSPLHKKFKQMDKEHMKAGSLTHDAWNKRYNLSKKLFKELKKKSPKNFDAVYGAF